MVSKLALYILNKDNTVSPFPSEAEQIVLYDFAFDAKRMGSAPEITSTIQANGNLEKEISLRVFCEYNNERYFLKALPSSSKGNSDVRYSYELTFVSERTVLDSVYMIDAVQGNGNIDVNQSNSTTVVFMATIEECVGRLNAALQYRGLDYSVVIDAGISSDSHLVSFQDKYFTEVLQEMVNIYKLPYYYVGKVIHFGWAQTMVPTLKYGDGLLSISKELRNDRIINRATATGSSENIPYYYPNPTPRGTIELVKPQGLGITIDSYLKFSQLRETDSLIYRGTRDMVKIFSQYSRDTNDPYATLNENYALFEKYFTLKTNGDVELLAGVKLISTDPVFNVRLECNIVTTVDEYNINNQLGVYGVFVYKRTGEHFVMDKTLGDNGVLPYKFSNSKDEFGNNIKKLFIDINSFPANEERLIGVACSASQYYANPLSGYFNFDCFQYGKESGWYILDGMGNLSANAVDKAIYGFSTSTIPNDGDTISYKVIEKTPFATTLMPPIYRESGGTERFYNAVNGEYDGVVFENEYSDETPKEGITKFEDIKPSIVGVTNASGERIDMFAEFAYDINDNDDTEATDDGDEEYIHPYFYAKLRKIDGTAAFNLFDQALESGEMMVEMTSGVCGACKFTIMVDENTQRNLVLVDDEGNLVYDEVTGKVKMATDATGLDRQNDTQHYEVWIALKKDINTYGQIMPNADYNHKPSVNDTFVLTNILMPESYVRVAEEKLKKAIIDWLTTNNAYHYNSGINFSRIYLQRHREVFDTLTENSALNLVYNNKEYFYYISSYSYRKQEELLPEISVELVESFESTPSLLNQTLTSVAEEVIGRLGGGTQIANADARYLRKNVPDVAKAKMSFEKGFDFSDDIHSTDFEKGDYFGRGFGVYKDEQGRTVVETDKLVVRADAQFTEVVINQTTFKLGTTVFSNGGCTITQIEDLAEGWRCYYDNKSGTQYSGFVVGDLARCQRYDANYGGIVKYYWREVVAVGDNYVDLSLTNADGSGIPDIGDDIVQFGNLNDSDRQGLIIIGSNPVPSVTQYEGVNSFELPEPTTKIAPNDNVFSGKVHIGKGSTGVENLDGLPDAIVNAVEHTEFGKYNLLRNSGFTGDYLSRQLDKDSQLNSDSELFSPTLEYWLATNVSVQESAFSESGAEVVFSNGEMSQPLVNNILMGESYMVSFKAKGSSITFSIAGVTKTIDLTDEYKYYSERITALTNDKIFVISSADATMCEVQIERGSVASVWGNSMWDNTSALVAYQLSQYLSSAIKDGSTIINGGLILSSMLALGNYVNGEMKQVTSGVNGIYNYDDDVAFWAGGDIAQAITTVSKIKSNPKYYPTDEEWANMAKFAVTHGGDVFMRGYIYALGGLFKGAVDIANGKIRLNEDGSGSLANGGYSWNAFGITKKTYPDMIQWVGFHEVIDDSNNISLDKGGYINNVDGYGTYEMPSSVEKGLSICLMPTEVVTRSSQSALIHSNIPFRVLMPDDTDFYETDYLEGNYLYINIHIGRKYPINMTFDGTYWQIDTEGTAGNDSSTSSNYNITLWS